MHAFIWVLVRSISVRKIIENHNQVNGGAHKVEKIVFSNFHLDFPNIRKSYLFKKGSLSKFEESL